MKGIYRFKGIKEMNKMEFINRISQCKKINEIDRFEEIRLKVKSYSPGIYRFKTMDEKQEDEFIRTVENVKNKRENNEVEIDESFLEICERFNKNNVKYVVCGAYACKLHGIEEIFGIVRLTNDYDFIVEKSEKNIKKIKIAISDTIPEINLMSDNEFSNYQVIKVVGKNELDLISSLYEIDYYEAIKDAEIKEIKGVRIPILSIDNLIKTKEKSFRERDKADVYWLRKLKYGK